MTTVFADWAQNYYDSGLSVLPIHPEKKACFIKGWTDLFSKRFPTIKEQEKYIELYGTHDIGLACGQSSGIVAIDFDYEGMADADTIEKLIIGALPPTPCIKRGAKGWTRFYRFDGDVKNASFDRFGVRMVDVLSTGRLTVLPPSTHKSGDKYQWIGALELLDCDEEDLPLLRPVHVKQLEEISQFDNSIFKEILKKKSRHDAIVGFILRNSDEARDLDELIQSTMQADIQLHKEEKKGPYLTDPNYLKGKTSYEFTRDLCQRVCDWKTRKRQESGIDWTVGKYPRLEAQGRKQSTNFEDFKSFFEFNYPQVRYDKIRQTPYYYSKRGERWEPIDNIREVIESQAHDAGLSPSYVNRHLQRWIQGLEARLCIDIPRWRGRDVLGEMVSKLSVTNISKEQTEELFKEWGSNIFRRLHDKSGRQQNQMLILKGGQGIGKDSWINYLFSGFGPYFSEIEVQDRKAENYQVVSDLLVANIPEFDETRKVSLSTLKSLITSPGASFRAAYARKSDYVPFYVSFISSCNFDYILRDSSGNRRFMIFDVDHIDWSYDDIPKDQLIAQLFHLYQLDYKASKSARMAMSEYVNDQTPEDLETLLVEEIDGYLSTQAKVTAGRKLRWGDIGKDVMGIAQRYKVGVKRVQALLKKSGMVHRDNKSTWYGVSNRARKEEGTPKDA